MDEIVKLSLAAIFHDIGKFRQRAGFDDLNDGELANFCKSYNNYYSHQHAAHSAKALEELGFSELASLAASHHLDTLEGDEKIIQDADRFASSLDRKANETSGTKKDEYIASGLETPFSFVYLNNEPKKHYYPLQKFEGKIEISSNKYCNDKEKYKKLYEKFKEEFKALNIDKNSITWQNLLEIKSILEKYTTFIPSSTYLTYPDVSLFDHSLATSAIAVAIKRGDGNEFSLIQGDFTSIQDFIFSKFGEKNKYLSKILRAKSFFVNISTELIALKIAKKLNLTPFNIVLNAGGKFTILSHKLTKEDKEKLKEIKEWINKEFEKINFLQTKFILASKDFDKEYFKLGEFSKVLKELASSFEEEKFCFRPQKDVFENYIEEVSQKGICDICGIVVASKVEEDAKYCKYCMKFKELGEKLPKTEFINFNLDDLISIEVSNEKDKDFSFGLSTHPIKRIANEVPIFSENEDNIKYIKKGLDEVKKGNVKSFDYIGADGLKIKDNKLIGKDYLAILKADIDSLGKIFICGFRGNNTFSRILYLSRMIDYFFTTILMDYIKNKPVYTVFAGGDDLFLIGHYESIIETYKWILNEFREYTKNEDFHLSASIVLTHSSTPLAMMKEIAEDDLDRSKSLDGKDGVTIFDITLKNSEFKEMLEKRAYFEELYEMLEKVESGISFMYRFFDFIEMQKNLKERKDILRNSWRYKFRYLVEKNFEKKGKEEMKRKLFELVVMIEKYDEKLIIPLNLFLYSIREEHLKGDKNV